MTNVGGPIVRPAHTMTVIRSIGPRRKALNRLPSGWNMPRNTMNPTKSSTRPVMQSGSIATESTSESTTQNTSGHGEPERRQIMTALELNVELLRQDVAELCKVLIDKEQGSPVSIIENSMLRLIEIYDLLGNNEVVNE